MATGAARKTITPFDTRDGFTKIHNHVIDCMMPTLKPNAFKVLVFIIRKTKGWGKDADRISYSQLRDGTGIKSDATLSAALTELEELRYILTEKRQGFTNNYILNTTLEIVVADTSTDFVSGTSTEIEEGTSTEIEDTKETTTKETNKRKRRVADATPPPSSEPVDDKPLTEQQQWFQVTCAIVGWDYQTLGQKERGQVAQTLGIIRKAGYSLDELKQFLPVVWFKDWRWTKNESLPTLSQLKTEIGKVRAKPQVTKNFVAPTAPRKADVYAGVVN